MYLYGCEAPKEKDDFDCKNRVRCPIWQCSGHLYTKTEDVQIDNDSAWQLPNIICDDCGTVFVNSLLVKMKIEAEASRVLQKSTGLLFQNGEPAV